jgi:carbon monoxide dehydrogenase subunit G
MPSVTCSRILAVEQSTVWEFIKDIGNWAPFLMGYQSHEVIDENRSTWTVRGEIGAFTRNVRFDVDIKEWVVPSRVSFRLQGVTEPFEGSGSVILGVPESDREHAAQATGSGRRWRLGALLLMLTGRWRRRARTLRQQAPNTAETAAQTSLSFNLNLAASGMTGPVINAMLEPMMLQAADELADRLIEVISAGDPLAHHHD